MKLQNCPINIRLTRRFLQPHSDENSYFTEPIHLCGIAFRTFRNPKPPTGDEEEINLQGDFFLTQWAFLGMRWLYEHLTGESIVLTVIISTLIIRALTVIGDIKSRQSSLKMQTIQPQIDRLQKKYKSDPQRLNVETQKLMKANGVSMLGGCLPMLFTMPLFFVFIAAFRQWGYEMMVKLIVTLNENAEAGVEMFRNWKFLWINNMWMADNGMTPVISAAKDFLNSSTGIQKLLYFKENPAALQMFEDLGFFIRNADGTVAIAELTEELTSKYNALVAPCIDLYKGYNNGWFVLPVVSAATTWVSMWLSTKMSGQSAAPANNSLKAMNWVMPLMTFVFCLTNNSAFALYWTVSNIASLITTYIINKSFAAKQAKTAFPAAEEE